MKGLLIPESGPLEEVEVTGLETKQALVGGYIEVVNLPSHVDGSDRASGYVNEESKFIEAHGINRRATDFMIGGLRFGDYIAGPFLLCGFDAAKGEDGPLPEGVVTRARLIEREAS